VSIFIKEQQQQFSKHVKPSRQVSVAMTTPSLPRQLSSIATSSSTSSTTGMKDFFNKAPELFFFPAMKAKFITKNNLRKV
jgi:hypothetical protein